MDGISKQSYSHYEVIIIADSWMEPGHLLDVHQDMGMEITFVQDTGGEANPIFQAFLKSSGDVIWIVDCLDELHPEKLNLHVKLFAENPAVGGIRSGFVRKISENECHTLHAVKSDTDMAEILLDGPVNFSDVVLRREWVGNFFSSESFSEPNSISSLPRYFFTKALLAGCPIIGLNKAINVRSDTVDEYIDLNDACRTAIHCLDRLFADPGMAPLITRWRDKAAAQTYLYWSIRAFGNEEIELGQRLFRSSVLLDRSILDIGAEAFFGRLIGTALQEGFAIDDFIGKIIGQLSPEFAWMSAYLNKSIARGYFYKAVDEFAFGRLDNARKSMVQAYAHGLSLTESDLMKALSILSDHEKVYGFEAVKPIVKNLSQLGKFIDRKKLNRIRSTWFINRAFAQYRENNYRTVPQKVIDALLISPAYILNPGVSSIFFKSMFHIVFRQGAA